MADNILDGGLAFQRVKRELLLPTDEDGIHLRMVDESWDELEATFEGPRDSPFAGGKFVVSMKIPEVFPFAPPKVKLHVGFIS